MIAELLNRITKSLEQKNIEYMLSGSIAMNSYAIPRMTLDIDLVIELNSYNLQDFLSIFKEGYYVNYETVKREVEERGMFNIIDHTTGFKIDFIVRKNTEYRKNEFARRIRTQISDYEIWMVSLEDLIISKIEWIQTLKSEKQINDINNLLANPDVDIEYIVSWCSKLKLNTFNFL